MLFSSQDVTSRRQDVAPYQCKLKHIEGMGALSLKIDITAGYYKMLKAIRKKIKEYATSKTCLHGISLLDI